MRDTQTTPVGWLLSFLKADLRRETPGRLLDFAWSVHRLPRQELFSGARGLSFQVGKYIRMTKDSFEPNIEGLVELQESVRAGLDLLRSGQGWELPAYPTKWSLVPHPTDDPEDEAIGTIHRRYDGDTTAAFYAAAADLIAESWARLRQCANAECRAYFLYDDPRQVYCSRACSDRVRQLKFKTNHQPKKRDHPAEHRARVAKRLPPGAAVKIGRTSTRTGRSHR